MPEIKHPDRPMVLLDVRDDRGNGIRIQGERGGLVRFEGTQLGWRVIESVSVEQAVEFCRNLKKWVT
jgi:hypothetical protein